MTSKPPVVFHDTSVLINFHRAQLLPALAQTLGSKVAWVATVREECKRKERELELPGLCHEAETFLGKPLIPERSEHRLIRT